MAKQSEIAFTDYVEKEIKKNYSKPVAVHFVIVWIFSNFTLNYIGIEYKENKTIWDLTGLILFFIAALPCLFYFQNIKSTFYNFFSITIFLSLFIGLILPLLLSISIFFSPTLEDANSNEKIITDIVCLIYMHVIFTLIFLYLASLLRHKITRNHIKSIDYFYFISVLIALFIKFYIAEIDTNADISWLYNRLSIAIAAFAIALRLVKLTIEIGHLHQNDNLYPYKNKVFPK